MSNELIREDEHGVVVEESKPETKKPKMYRVVILNDDYTPMDFVVRVLKRFFYKSTEEATRVMLQIHYEGQGTAGIYTSEIAETKVQLVNDYSKANDHPLMCTMEEE